MRLILVNLSGWEAVALVCRVPNPQHSWNFRPCCIERCFDILLVFPPQLKTIILQTLRVSLLSPLSSWNDTLDCLFLSAMTPCCKFPAAQTQSSTSQCTSFSSTQSQTKNSTTKGIDKSQMHRILMDWTIWIRFSIPIAIIHTNGHFGKKQVVRKQSVVCHRTDFHFLSHRLESAVTRPVIVVLFFSFLNFALIRQDQLLWSFFNIHSKTELKDYKKKKVCDEKWERGIEQKKLSLMGLKPDKKERDKEHSRKEKWPGRAFRQQKTLS